MQFLSDPQIWIAFATLTVLELVLGIDNIVFVSILSGRLPAKEQPRARFIGLALALVMRVILLFSLTWVMGLVQPLFTVFGQHFSGRDLILLIGGLFLLFGRELPVGSSFRMGPGYFPAILSWLMVGLGAVMAGLAWRAGLRRGCHRPLRHRSRRTPPP